MFILFVTLLIGSMIIKFSNSFQIASFMNRSHKDKICYLNSLHSVSSNPFVKTLLSCSSSSSSSSLSSSNKKILCVGANAIVGSMCVKLLNENGYDTSTVTVPDDLSQIDNLLQTSSFDLIILGGAVPKYPDIHAQLLKSISQYASTSIIHQVISPKPVVNSNTPPPPLPLEVMGNRIADSNLKTANEYFLK